MFRSFLFLLMCPLFKCHWEIEMHFISRIFLAGFVQCNTHALRLHFSLSLRLSNVHIIKFIAAKVLRHLFALEMVPFILMNCWNESQELNAKDGVCWLSYCKHASWWLLSPMHLHCSTVAIIGLQVNNVTFSGTPLWEDDRGAELMLPLEVF